MKKKILSIVLSLALCFGASLTAFAADTQIPEGKTANPESPADAETVEHTYAAYQIFTGVEGKKADGTGNGTFHQVSWGTDATDAVKAAIQTQFAKDQVEIKNEKDQAITWDEATPKDIARAIQDSATLNVERLAAVVSKALSGDGVEIKENEKFGGVDGWYIIVDTTSSLWGEYDLYRDRAQFRLFIGERVDFKINNKRSKIEIHKTVQDINDSVEVVDPYGNSADYDIGDAVPFKITSNLPDNLSDYESYTFTVNDRQDEGFDFPQNFVVTVDGTVLTEGYTVVPRAYDKDGKIDENGEKNDFDVEFGDVIKNAIFKNGSTIVVEYTSVLNEKAKKGNGGNENTSRITYNPDNEGDGHTPWDIVIVFTFEPQIKKLDQAENPLTGAEFDLVKVKATKNGNKYVVTTDENGDDVVVKGYPKTFDKADNGYDFSVNGIDDGVYKIVETTTPDGYNSIEPIYFVVVATHSYEGKLISLDIVDLNGDSMDPGEEVSTALKTAMKANKTDGTIKTTVINQKGVVLPSTGGIGTTIFYIVGGVLVVGAVVLLIVRRKMRTEEE